jgi:RNA polymerase sigma-70 factor, ECF subfamily
MNFRKKPFQPLSDDCEEQKWVERIRTGDEKAFAALFNRHYGRLHQFAGRIARDSQAAEDIVQEVFVKLWTARENLTIKSNVRAYLYKAVYNRALNNLQHRRVELCYSENAQLYASSPETPDEILHAGEFERAVNRAVDELPEACREVFLLRKQDGLSYAEIAAVRGISVNTVKTQLSRALKALLKCLPGR